MATFILRTGKQGNGKTLNTIKEVDEKAHKEGRTVYYCNVTNFKPEHPAIKATWIEFDHPETWFELPKNAIIIIDEAQTWFRVRPQGSKVPLYASRLEIMRKDGHELHCITQSPKLIDSHMRELCNMHIHYNRGNGGKLIKRWVFQNPNLTVGDKLEFPDGESSRITIDRSYFGCYDSVKEGAEHHFKFRVPKAAYVFGICCVLLAAAVWKIAQRYVSPDPVSAEAVEQPVSEPAKPDRNPLTPSEMLPVTPEQYASRMVPRIPDVPASAPIYDQLTQAQSFPKPFCVSTTDEQMIRRNYGRMTVKLVDGTPVGCRCNTQQGTRLDVSHEFCLSVVNNGYFDHTKPDRMPNDMRDSASAGVTGRDGAAGTYGGAGLSSPVSQPAASSRFAMVDHSKPQPPAEYVPQRPSSGFVVVGSGNAGHLW